jgi:glycosyltransferase involved in cell wall biosynthesis
MSPAKTKVSVVVPLYNPGEYVQPCIDSLLSQTLPPDELEIIFVDDGSTDDTLERVRAVESQHPQVRVISIPNSGWPGKPRNVGTDVARGEYVMYMDQDDRMEPDALEAMYDMGAAAAADVVLGKVISDFRGVNHRIYRRNRPSCTVHDAPLMESLTPHKLFRREFLRAHDIRYPEGPRRLEDQLFMAKAYFAADAASIVSDRVCYRYLRRPDGGNAGSKRFDPAVYYNNLREVLDVVDAHVPPGEERDDFYRRFLRVELLGRLGGKAVGRWPTEYLDSLLDEVRRLMDERFPDSVAEGLGAAMRVRTAVVRRGTRQDVLRLADAYNVVTEQPRLLEVRPSGSSHVVGVEMRWTFDGAPLVLEQAGDRLLLPRSLVGSIPTDDERRVDDQLDSVSSDVIIRHREQLDEWFVGHLPGEVVRGRGGPELVVRGTAKVDASTAAGGHPLLPGPQDFHVRSDAFLWSRTRRLGAWRVPGLASAPPVTDGDGRLVLCYYTTPHSNLSLDVDPTPKTGRARLALTPIESATTRRLVCGQLPDTARPVPYEVYPIGVPGQWHTHVEGGRLVSRGSRRLPRGAHAVELSHPTLGSTRLKTVLYVGWFGRVTLGAEGKPPPARPVHRRVLSRGRRELRRLARNWR